MSNPKSSRPTMLDVAKLAGVSYQTVSRVINDHPYVSSDVRQRVKAAIKTLGYRPSKAATKLASKSSKIIATVLYVSKLHPTANLVVKAIVVLAVLLLQSDEFRAFVTHPLRRRS